MRWLHPDHPFAPRKLPFFYGWVVVVVSTLGVVMSIPGQTMGVSVFTDHLIEATGLSRLDLANVYLVGTFASGLLLPKGGQLLDRFGARFTGFAATSVLALTLLFLSVCDRIALGAAKVIPGLSPQVCAALVLGVGFASLRFSGQGMLTMVSRTMLGRWWHRSRGRISGLSGVFISFGFASAPLLLHAWIVEAGWRGAWWQMGLVVGLGMGAVILLFYRDTPEECGLGMDGDPWEPPETTAVVARSASGPAPARPVELTDGVQREFTRGEAVRTLAFWVVTLALCNQSMVITAVTFHIVDIGAENGLAAAQAVGIFLPVAVVSTSLGLLVGWAADRHPLRVLILGMMIAQAISFAAIAHLGDPMFRVLAIVGWGVASSFFGPMTVAALPMFFGRAHLGAISAVQMMCLVVASAAGPSLLAVSREMLGSYTPALYACCSLPAIVFILALSMRDPRRT